MKIYGIIAEYNPFHNGHHYLIDEARHHGATHVVSVMSGNFVQRGETAIVSKYVRAEMAVRNGVDLVLELPVPFALSTAQQFASGAVSVLSGLSTVDSLAFGSESGNLSSLLSISDALAENGLKHHLDFELLNGTTFAKARQLAIENMIGKEAASALSNPNDTLAVEYISAANKSKTNFEFLPIKRIGSSHDSYSTASDYFCSATQIRAQVNQPDPLFFTQYMPPIAAGLYFEEIKSGNTADLGRLETAILAHLRTIPKDVFALTPDISEGLENRILREAERQVTLDGLYFAVKTKRYSLARIRRIILCSYLGITKEMQRLPVPYIRILAMNEKGLEILSAAKKNSVVPILTSLKDAERLGEQAKQLAQMEVRAGDVYSLCLKNPRPAKEDYTRAVIKLK